MAISGRLAQRWPGHPHPFPFVLDSRIARRRGVDRAAQWLVAKASVRVMVVQRHGLPELIAWIRFTSLP